MKIAIFSDCHVGFKRFKKRSAMPLSALEECIDRCRQADIVICPGDVFDVAKPALQDIRHSQLLARKLPKVDALFGQSGYILMVCGNHEKVETLSLLDCALVQELKYGLLIPNFYLVKGEILIVYGLDYQQNQDLLLELKFAKEDPFFDKNPQFKGLKRTAILLLHENNNPLYGQLNLQFVHNYNRSAKTPISFVINGHEHDFRLVCCAEHFPLSDADLYTSELKLLQPGSFVRTKINQSIQECRQYAADHFLLLDSATGELRQQTISSKQITFKHQFQQPCQDVQDFKSDILQKMGYVTDTVFEIERQRVRGLDQDALAFAARRAGMEPLEYQQLIDEMLRSKDLGVYRRELIFRPAILVTIAYLEPRQDQAQLIKSIDLDTLLEPYNDAFENSNYLEITLKSSAAENQGNLDIEAIKTGTELQMSYQGITILRQYIQTQLADLQNEDAKLDLEQSIEGVKTKTERCIMEALIKAVNADTDVGDAVQAALAGLGRDE